MIDMYVKNELQFDHAKLKPKIARIKLLGTLTDPGNRMVQIPGFCKISFPALLSMLTSQLLQTITSVHELRKSRIYTTSFLRLPDALQQLYLPAGQNLH